MIKVYCDDCHGKGYFGTGQIPVKDCECKACLGKGYTELEPYQTIENWSICEIHSKAGQTLEIYKKEIKESK